MDEFKVKLSTRFMRTLVSKLISRAIRKKYGYKINVHLGDLDIESFDGDTSIKANVELTIDSNELKKILEDVGLD